MHSAWHGRRRPRSHNSTLCSDDALLLPLLFGASFCVQMRFAFVRQCNRATYALQVSRGRSPWHLSAAGRPAFLTGAWHTEIRFEAKRQAAQRVDAQLWAQRRRQPGHAWTLQGGPEIPR